MGNYLRNLVKYILVISQLFNRFEKCENQLTEEDSKRNPLCYIERAVLLPTCYLSYSNVKFWNNF